MKPSMLVLGLVLSSLAVSFNAVADDDNDRYDRSYGRGYYDGDQGRHGHHGHGRHSDDFAKVIDVDPIIEISRTPYTRQQCWDEQAAYSGRDRHDAAGAMILGGIVGGVVGNQVGEGRGRDAATLLGTLVGASIGHDMSGRNAPSTPVVNQRCRTITQYDENERVAGYRVTYRYRGQTYVTRTDRHPGSMIRVGSMTASYDD